MGVNTSKATAGTPASTTENFSVFQRILATSVSKDVALPEVPDVSSPPPELPSLVQQAYEIEKEREKLGSPGLYENIQNEVKNVLTPGSFDGFRCDVSRYLGQRFAISHSFLLGSSMIPGGLYQFGANVIMGDAHDPSTLLISKITPDGSLDARWNQKISSKVAMRVQAQLKSEEDASQVLSDFDYLGDDFTFNMKIANGLLLGATYLQNITKNFSLGGEGYYYGKHEKIIQAYCAKYSTKQWTGIVTYGSMGSLQLHYLRKVGDRVRLASELAYNIASGESHANAGLEVTLRQSRFVTNIDQTGKISTMLEAKVLPSILLMLSADAAPSEDAFKFGYGFQISG